MFKSRNVKKPGLGILLKNIISKIYFHLENYRGANVHSTLTIFNLHLYEGQYENSQQRHTEVFVLYAVRMKLLLKLILRGEQQTLQSASNTTEQIFESSFTF